MRRASCKSCKAAPGLNPGLRVSDEGNNKGEHIYWSVILSLNEFKKKKILRKQPAYAEKPFMKVAYGVDF